VKGQGECKRRWVSLVTRWSWRRPAGCLMTWWLCQCYSRRSASPSPALTTSMTTTDELEAVQLRRWTSTTTARPRLAAAGFVDTWHVRSGTRPGDTCRTVCAIALHRKTNTNTNPNLDPNRYRRRCPDPNARIQKFIHYMATTQLICILPQTCIDQYSHQYYHSSMSVGVGIGRSAPSVCLSVCLFVCPQHKSKTNDPKVFKLGIANDCGIH